jgi:hypothetical protein
VTVVEREIKDTERERERETTKVESSYNIHTAIMFICISCFISHIIKRIRVCASVLTDPHINTNGVFELLCISLEWGIRNKNLNEIASFIQYRLYVKSLSLSFFKKQVRFHNNFFITFIFHELLRSLYKKLLWYNHT